MIKGCSKRSFAVTRCHPLLTSITAQTICSISLSKERGIKKMVPQGQLNTSPQTHVIDATGQYVIPGLWDAHVHMTAWPEMTEKISTLYIANGITSVRDMGGRLEDILAFRAGASEEDAIAPRILDSRSNCGWYFLVLQMAEHMGLIWPSR